MTALATLVAAGLGFGLGLAYFAALRWNVRLYLTPHRRAAGAALHVGRLLGIGGGLYLAARLGAGPLLGAAAGVLVARPIATRWAPAEPPHVPPAAEVP